MAEIVISAHEQEAVAREARIRAFVKSEAKSRIASFFLTLLFGPLGMFYASISGGLIMTGAALLLSPTIVGPLLLWPLAIGFGDHVVYHHNRKLRLKAEATVR